MVCRNCFIYSEDTSFCSDICPDNTAFDRTSSTFDQYMSDHRQLFSCLQRVVYCDDAAEKDVVQLDTYMEVKRVAQKYGSFTWGRSAP